MIVSLNSVGTGMNIFRSEAAPYFFALVASALGWFATNIANETNARRIALYSIRQEPAATERESDTVRILIENISRSSTIKDAQFMFVCRGGDEECFQPGPEGAGGPPKREIIATPPLYTDDIVPSGNEESLVLRVTLVANSALDLRLFPRESKAGEVAFYYVPEGDMPQDILFMESGGIVAWFLRNYFSVLILSLFVTMGIFVFLVGLNLAQFLSSLKKREPKDDPPSKHNVTLRFDAGNRT
jgi:hypothetical protein